MLRSLRDALQRGEPIYATILATGVNQDGRTQGISYPNIASQQALLKSVYSQAGVKPSEVSYVEAHGTGTQVGDPIEAEAIGTTLGQGRSSGNWLPIGSVKTNIGHLESGAGLAGLIKVALALKHGTVPASLHFRNPNPSIAFEALGIRVQSESGPVSQTSGRAIAGVNSFGFGGTNAHCVLAAIQENVGGPSREPSTTPDPNHPLVLPLSARSENAIKRLAASYANVIGSNAELTLSNVCRTASLNRSALSHRAVVVASSIQEARESLTAIANESSDISRLAARRNLDVSHLFTPAWARSGTGWGVTCLNQSLSIVMPLSDVMSCLKKLLVGRLLKS